MTIDQVAQKLGAVKGADVLKSDPAATGVHLDVVLPPESVREFAEAVRSMDFLIESVSALDAKPDMLMLYHFTAVDVFIRICARVRLWRGDKRCPTIEDIYPGANWHERETHDFFGIVFTGHPDMSPLILPEDAGNLMPLLKKEEALKELGDLLPRFAPPKPAAEEKPEVAQ